AATVMFPKLLVLLAVPRHHPRLRVLDVEELPVMPQRTFGVKGARIDGFNSSLSTGARHQEGSKHCRNGFQWAHLASSLSSPVAVVLRSLSDDTGLDPTNRSKAKGPVRKHASNATFGSGSFDADSQRRLAPLAPQAKAIQTMPSRLGRAVLS